MWEDTGFDGEDTTTTESVQIQVPMVNLDDNSTLLPFVLAVTANVLYRFPNLLGYNVTNITFGTNSICFHGGTHSVTRVQSFQYEVFKAHLTDANQLYILEWIRPLFSCWLVLSITYWLPRTTAGRV